MIGALLLALLAQSEPKAFLQKHCAECHDAETKKGNLDLTALRTDFSKDEEFGRWVKVYDRVLASRSVSTRPCICRAWPTTARGSTPRCWRSTMGRTTRTN